MCAMKNLVLVACLGLVQISLLIHSAFAQEQGDFIKSDIQIAGDQIVCASDNSIYYTFSDSLMHYNRITKKAILLNMIGDFQDVGGLFSKYAWCLDSSLIIGTTSGKVLRIKRREGDIIKELNVKWDGGFIGLRKQREILLSDKNVLRRYSYKEDEITELDNTEFKNRIIGYYQNDSIIAILTSDGIKSSIYRGLLIDSKIFWNSECVIQYYEVPKKILLCDSILLIASTDLSKYICHENSCDLSFPRVKYGGSPILLETIDKTSVVMLDEFGSIFIIDIKDITNKKSIVYPGSIYLYSSYYIPREIFFASSKEGVISYKYIYNESDISESHVRNATLSFIYPNPVNNWFVIYNDDNMAIEDPSRFSLYNIAGVKTLDLKRNNGVFCIPNNSITPGIYYLLNCDSGYKKIYKMVYRN
jgi:hypothetical protein